MYRFKKIFKKHLNNSVVNNLKMWSNYDWTNLGEEWSNNEEWKESLVEHILNPNIPEGSDVLEIGPGGGRFTEYLLDRGNKIYLVDLTQKCIDLCKERFKEYSNIYYFVNDGKSLDMIADNSIDRIWSWDVFVHINDTDIKNYVRQFDRILRPGGIGIIHHSKKGKSSRGWHSNMTAKKMCVFCNENNLEVISQLECWGNENYQIWPNLDPDLCPDTISIFKKLNE